MLDGARHRTATGPARHQRSRGRAAVALSRRGGATRLDRLAQAGCAKAFLPRAHGSVPEVVFLNTAGGLTGGDRLELALDLGPGAAAVATTQTAERAYASLGDWADMQVRLTLGDGARLVWCPQETILFERAALARRTLAELSGSAELLAAETVVFGRLAMGETPEAARLADWREVRRDGVPLVLEPVRIGPDWLAARGGAALMGPGTAMASLWLVAADAEDRLAGLRALLPEPGPALSAAASAWDGRLALRAVGQDVLALRRLVGQALCHLSGAALPRVWQL